MGLLTCAFVIYVTGKLAPPADDYANLAQDRADGPGRCRKDRSRDSLQQRRV